VFTGRGIACPRGRRLAKIVRVNSVMRTVSLPAEIARPSVNHAAIADRVARQPDSLPELFAGLRSDKPRIKYGCLKVLRLISERNPAMLYPAFEQFGELLRSEFTVLQWGAIIILRNLAVIDSENKIDAILDRYLQPIPGPVMITAANTIQGAGKIARAKPYLADKITRALLQVERAKYKTAECRNVVLGHAVLSLDLLFDHVREPRPVIAFVQRQLRNRRNATKRKAAVFLKRHGPAARGASSRSA